MTEKQLPYCLQRFFLYLDIGPLQAIAMNGEYLSLSHLTIRLPVLKLAGHPLSNVEFLFSCEIFREFLLWIFLDNDMLKK